MEHETGCDQTEFVWLKPKIYLIDNNNKHKKVKGVNRNAVVATSHNKYKEDFFNNKCIRHRMNGTQSKDHRIGTFETNKISLSCFDGKIYIQHNCMMD